VSTRELPAEYVAVSRPRVAAFAWAAAATWVDAVLDEASTLHLWAARHELDRHGGRGPVHVVAAAVPGPDASARWAVRHYRRGGALVAPLLGDRYWGRGRRRPERELHASVHARAHGVRTPAVVAGAAYRAGSSGIAGFYRADLVTECVPGARSMADMFRHGDRQVLAALQAAGGVVRALARAGVMHADVNASNVVLDSEGDAWVLDLDRSRKLTRPSARAGATMLRRLERSLAKLASARGRSVSPGERAALRAGFEERP
jgi:3-deoxy-D-manno-octulosonic acid kinase